jgi:hypothetical protein
MLFNHSKKLGWIDERFQEYPEEQVTRVAVSWLPDIHYIKQKSRAKTRDFNDKFKN